MGPQEGYLQGDYSDKGLHFLGGIEPLHHYLSSEQQELTHHLVTLKGDRWVPHLAQQLLRRVPGTISWRQNDDWLFAPYTRYGQRRKYESETTLEVYWLKGPESDDIVGPIQLGHWKGDITFTAFAVSDAGDMCALGYRDDQNDIAKATKLAWLFRLGQHGEVTSSKLPFPPGLIPNIRNLKWSPTNQLYFTYQGGGQVVDLFTLTDLGWELSAEVHQPDRDGQIFDSKLFFGQNGQPMVVWEDFFPH